MNVNPYIHFHNYLYFFLNPEATPKRIWDIKWKIKDIGKQYHAELLTYELNVDGKWISVDFKPGLKYKDRILHTA